VQLFLAVQQDSPQKHGLRCLEEEMLPKALNVFSSDSSNIGDAFGTVGKGVGGVGKGLGKGVGGVGKGVGKGVGGVGKVFKKGLHLGKSEDA